jgi:hypothetical protein
LDTTTFPTWADQSLQLDQVGLRSMTKLFQGGNLSAVKLAVTVEMSFCERECVEERCTRRLDETDSDAADAEDTANAHGDSDKEQQRSLLNSRQNAEDARRLESSNSCTKECVKYKYYPGWSTTAPSEAFPFTADVQEGCGLDSQGRPVTAQANPTMIPTGMTLGTKTLSAQPNQVKTTGKGWALNGKQVAALSMNSASEPQVALEIDPEMQTWTGGPLTNANSQTFTNHIDTCEGGNTIGCVKVTFEQSTPSQVNILNKVAGPGTFFEGDWEVDGQWLCKTQGVQRICPSTSMDVTKGLTSCVGGQTKEDFFSTMKAENDMTTWLYRLIALLACYCGISCILSPITTMVNMVLDGADYITGWIPGIGCLVDSLTDVISGVVGCVVFCISLFFAISCFSIVAGVVWVAMRPMIGIPLMILACCCFGGGVFVCMQSRKPKGGHGMETDSDEEGGMS